jgi:hypothetical protein
MPAWRLLMRRDESPQGRRACSALGYVARLPLVERVLSIRQLNRALLARQFLLERSKLPLTRALQRIGGLQAHYAPSTYIGLWWRLHDFRREALTKALDGRRVLPPRRREARMR